ncbi:hypothetical protein [Pseudonocardia sp. ICBG601]|uniref:hypothetical protein n=1 Tax=Pseudonocardia sp. ICBG601 TaxID=2846759 RepID=UPI001CF61DB5|nr:hypothetical protein [Pseudonocardia sp. ICBG601]
MIRDALCERCLNPIDPTTEPLRMRTHGGTTPAGGPVRSFVHALPCARPDTGDWDHGRRGLPRPRCSTPRPAPTTAARP